METDWELLETMAGGAAIGTDVNKWIIYRPFDNPDLEKGWPPPVSLKRYSQIKAKHRAIIALKPELIKGVLRCGQKMLISGASKAGKTCLLMRTHGPDGSRCPR